MQKHSIQKSIDLPFNSTVVLIKQNDATTLKNLYKTNFAKVKRYVLKNSGDEQQAKDVYQEAFVAMWRNIKNDKFTAESENAINGYIFQIAKYKWLDHVRSVKYKNTTFINRDIEYDEPDIEIDEVTNKKIKYLIKEIKQVNLNLWDIEDKLRICEKNKDFGQTFVELARNVYFNNDKRAKIKSQINEILGSDIREIKQYVDY